MSKAEKELDDYVSSHAEYLRPWIRYCLREEYIATQLIKPKGDKRHE